MAVVVFTAMQADERVVGLKHRRPGRPPRIPAWQFDDQMKILDFLWRRFDKPLITLHARRTDPALRSGRVHVGPHTAQHRRRAMRGGSAMASPSPGERDVVGLLQQMAKEEVLVEINLTSNESILGVRDDAHPFELYRRAGVPVCLTTDDEGVSRSNLTMEYVKAVQRYDLEYEDIKAISRELPGPLLPAGGYQGRALGHAGCAAFARFEKSLATGYRESND